MKKYQKISIGASMKTALQGLARVEEALTRPSSFYEVFNDVPAADREEMLNRVQQIQEVIAQAFTRFDLPVAKTSREQVVHFNAGLVSVIFHDLAPEKYQKKFGELPKQEAAALQAYCAEAAQLLECLMRRLQ
jgi:diadenosine tetraphosphate (Ap4A) HIT family hydrolase